MTDLRQLNAAILISLTYYKSIEALETQSLDLALGSVSLYSSSIRDLISEEEFTSQFLHDRGFVHYVAATLSGTAQERREFIDIAWKSLQQSLSRLPDETVAQGLLKKRVDRLAKSLRIYQRQIEHDFGKLVPMFGRSRTGFQQHVQSLDRSWLRLDGAMKDALAGITRDFVRCESRISRDLRLVEAFRTIEGQIVDGDRVSRSS